MLRERLNAALKTANENHHRCRAATIRLIQTAVQERDTQARSNGHPEGLDDSDITGMLQSMVEHRQSSIRRYEETGRLDLVEREREEMGVIESFLPPKLDDAACERAVLEVIREVGAQKLKDTGRVISALKGRYGGQMDFSKARRLICSHLD